MHREKSLTPWITNESVASIARGEDTFKTTLPAQQFDRAVALGCDMTWFKREEQCPTKTTA